MAHRSSTALAHGCKGEGAESWPAFGSREIDETYVGGRLREFKGYGKGEYLKNKTTIMGMVERGGSLRTQIIPNERRATMLPIAQANVAKGATVSTDTHSSYSGLKKLGYRHGRLNHNIEEWKRGVYCTNTIEGFWSHLKRGIASTHLAVSRQHLQKYADEFAFRYNNRKTPTEMFDRMLKQITNAN